MSKTLSMRSEIQSELKKLCDNVYFDRADKNAKIPYVSYYLEEIMCTDNLTLCELEIFVCDRGLDTTTCETLSDNIQKVFDHFEYLDDTLLFRTFKGRRQKVDEKDENKIRRRLTFEVRLYERG